MYSQTVILPFFLSDNLNSTRLDVLLQNVWLNCLVRFRKMNLWRKHCSCHVWWTRLSFCQIKGSVWSSFFTEVKLNPVHLQLVLTRKDPSSPSHIRHRTGGWKRYQSTSLETNPVGGELSSFSFSPRSFWCLCLHPGCLHPTFEFSSLQFLRPTLPLFLHPSKISKPFCILSLSLVRCPLRRKEKKNLSICCGYTEKWSAVILRTWLRPFCFKEQKKRGFVVQIKNKPLGFLAILFDLNLVIPHTMKGDYYNVNSAHYHLMTYFKLIFYFMPIMLYELLKHSLSFGHLLPLFALH